MVGISLFVSIIIILFGVLQIILFFKLWKMTNDVNEMKNMMELFFRKEFQGQEIKQIVTPEKKEEQSPQPYKEIPKKELPIIDENSNDFKQYLLKWKILKDKGYTEQAVREYMEYTQLERDFAEDFINNL